MHNHEPIFGILPVSVFVNNKPTLAKRKNSTPSPELQELFALHKQTGFKGIVHHWLDRMDALLKLEPTSMQYKTVASTDPILMEEMMTSSADTHIPPFAQLSQDWLGSGFCNHCLDLILKEYDDYLKLENPTPEQKKQMQKSVKDFRDNRYRIPYEE